MNEYTIANNIAAYAAGEKAFAQQFNLIQNSKQRAGTAWDFECPHTGKRYELKTDATSLRTGNHYLEILYSNNGGLTWRPSGFDLAKKQADMYVVKSGPEYIFIECPKLEQLTLTHDFRTVTTSTGAGGNGPGVYSRGLLVPMTLLRTIAHEITPVE